jgi:hypothetical protein
MRTNCLVALCIIAVSSAPPVFANEVTFSSFGWTITVDTEGTGLSFRHERLGVVLDKVDLNVAVNGQFVRPKSWQVKANGDNRLVIKTLDPKTAWNIDIAENAVRISSTSDNAMLTAHAPAPSERILARLVDREGTPVDWVGTAEVAHTYGGGYTHNVSFLPRRNPECMYFALGEVSAMGLHSLFDRPTDIAVDFPEDVSFTRNSQNLDVLDVRLPVPGSTSIRLILDYFTKTLGTPFYVPYDDASFPSAPMVWSSWTSYYEGVREEDIVRNADWIADHLRPYGFQFVQLDDGYDRGAHGEHYWISNWNDHKFPHGPKWLADYIRSKGLRPGIWLVPNSYAGAFQQHPDWYVYYKDGKVVSDYNTPALDSSNPAVLEFLNREFSTMAGWGYDYFKIDGEHAIPKYVPQVDLSRLYNHSIDPVQAYRNRLGVIRNAIGHDRFIEVDLAGTPLNATGYVNSFFNGDDLYDNWQGMYALFSAISANSFFNHILAYNMPGEGMSLEPYMKPDEAAGKKHPKVIETVQDRESPVIGYGTTLAEARTVVTYVALSGVAYSLASAMPDLPEERIELLHKTLPTVPVFPVDLFSRGTDMTWDKFKHVTPDDYIHNYPEILDLKVQAPAGRYDVVGMTNWRSWGETRQLWFAEKLGLDPDAAYIAFDFWNQKITGVFQKSMTAEVLPHDTRVFALHRIEDHPQLVGVSRHISGAYSVLQVKWDGTRNSLAGSSQGIAGEPYTVWIYVPNGMEVAQVTASAAAGPTPVKQLREGNSLAITFAGQTEPVNWEAAFTGAGR